MRRVTAARPVYVKQSGHLDNCIPSVRLADWRGRQPEGRASGPVYVRDRIDATAHSGASLSLTDEGDGPEAASAAPCT